MISGSYFCVDYSPVKQLFVTRELCYFCGDYSPEKQLFVTRELCYFIVYFKLLSLT